MAAAKDIWDVSFDRWKIFTDANSKFDRIVLNRSVYLTHKKAPHGGGALKHCKFYQAAA